MYLFYGASNRLLSVADFKRLNLFRSKVREDLLVGKESDKSSTTRTYCIAQGTILLNIL